MISTSCLFTQTSASILNSLRKCAQDNQSSPDCAASLLCSTRSPQRLPSVARWFTILVGMLRTRMPMPRTQISDLVLLTHSRSIYTDSAPLSTRSSSSCCIRDLSQTRLFFWLNEPSPKLSTDVQV